VTKIRELALGEEGDAAGEAPRARAQGRAGRAQAPCWRIAVRGRWLVKKSQGRRRDPRLGRCSAVDLEKISSTR
jgi:hypothetical protein